MDELGYNLLLVLVPLWDSELGKGFIATIRSLLAGTTEVSLVRSFLQEVIAVEVGARVDNPPGSGRLRVQFVASQLVGVVMARYILELDPFKSLPVEQIAETIGPNLQRYLTGDLPGSAFAISAASSSSETSVASLINSTGMPSSIRYARRSRGIDRSTSST